MLQMLLAADLGFHRQSFQCTHVNIIFLSGGLKRTQSSFNLTLHTSSQSNLAVPPPLMISKYVCTCCSCLGSIFYAYNKYTLSCIVHIWAITRLRCLDIPSTKNLLLGHRSWDSGEPTPKRLLLYLRRLQRAAVLTSCSLWLIVKWGEGERPGLFGPMADISIVNACF